MIRKITKFVRCLKQKFRNNNNLLETMNKLVLGVEVVDEDGASLFLISPGSDNSRRASNNLAGLSFLVVLAESAVLADDLLISDLDEWDVVLSAEGLDQLDVLWLVTVLGENAEVSLTPETCL